MATWKKERLMSPKAPAADKDSQQRLPHPLQQAPENNHLGSFVPGHQKQPDLSPNLGSSQVGSTLNSYIKTLHTWNRKLLLLWTLQY